MITILNYGMGNLGSMSNMFRHIGFESIVTSDISEIEKATHLIIPGVGSFDGAMDNLNATKDLVPTLTALAFKKRIPILGVCLGMQLFMHSSEEGILPGLGWVDGKVCKFNSDKNLKVPHMGWNQAIKASNKCGLTNNISATTRYYFVHSYYVKLVSESNLMFETDYGLKFASGIYNENLFGVQFHPEKSHHFGMSFLKSFARL